MRPTRRDLLGAGAGFAGAGALARLVDACRVAESALGGVDLATAMRADAYSLDPRITFLNHGSVGTMPRLVQEARARYLAECEANPWLTMWSGLWDEARERTRASAARLLGCAVDEVAINHSTTEGFNLLAAGLPLGDGDEVLYSSLNHDGASVCWTHRESERGVTVRTFEFPVERLAALTAEEVVALHAEHVTPRTRVLCFPHIDNHVGLRHPVAELVAMARAKGVEFVAVDGAQSVGMIPVDVAALGVDFYACSTHKWVQSAKGLGLLFVRRELQPKLRPHHVTWGQKRWAGTARVFEDFGTRNLPEVLALRDAIEFQQQRGIAQGERRLRELRDHARARVDAEPRLTWDSPVDWSLSASLWAIGLRDRDPERAADLLWTKHGIVARGFGGAHGALRVSPNLANTPAELDRLFDVLRRDVLG